MMLIEDIYIYTGKFVRIVAVDIEQPDHIEARFFPPNRISEVEIKKLLFGWVEPETRKIIPPCNGHRF